MYGLWLLVVDKIVAMDVHDDFTTVATGYLYRVVATCGYNRVVLQYCEVAVTGMTYFIVVL